MTIGEYHFLNNIFAKSDLSLEELAIITLKFKQVTFDKNSYWLTEGRSANHCWFVQHGFAHSYVIHPKGNDIATNFYSVGNIVIDWPSFFLRSPTR